VARNNPKNLQNRPFLNQGPFGSNIGYWSVGVIAFDAEPSATISFAILACASRFTSPPVQRH
jgi:hypothetical protein